VPFVFTLVSAVTVILVNYLLDLLTALIIKAERRRYARRQNTTGYGHELALA
jgi:hypothetical protein